MCGGSTARLACLMNAISIGPALGARFFTERYDTTIRGVDVFNRQISGSGRTTTDRDRGSVLVLK